MNAREKKRKIKKPSDQYQCSGDSCILLPQGTTVRVALDAPRDVVSGKRLHGKFRDSDIRWDIKQRTIMQLILQPNQPPMYLVSDDDGNIDRRQAYTKNQLQVVADDEIQPQSSAILPIKGNKGEKLYVIDKLMNKKTIKKRVYYLVKWAGFSHAHNTWEPRTKLMKEVPDLVKDFEKKNVIDKSYLE